MTRLRCMDCEHSGTLPDMKAKQVYYLVCGHPTVPVNQPRKDARASTGACGPDKRLFKAQACSA